MTEVTEVGVSLSLEVNFQKEISKEGKNHGTEIVVNQSVRPFLERAEAWVYSNTGFRCRIRTRKI